MLEYVLFYIYLSFNFILSMFLLGGEYFVKVILGIWEQVMFGYPGIAVILKSLGVYSPKFLNI